MFKCVFLSLVFKDGENYNEEETRFINEGEGVVSTLLQTMKK